MCDTRGGVLHEYALSDQKTNYVWPCREREAMRTDMREWTQHASAAPRRCSLALAVVEWMFAAPNNSISDGDLVGINRSTREIQRHASVDTTQSNSIPSSPHQHMKAKPFLSDSYR